MATSPRTPEGQAAKRFADSLNTLAFNPHMFAHIFALQPDALQVRFAEVMLAMIETWRDQETAKYLPGTALAVVMSENVDRV